MKRVFREEEEEEKYPDFSLLFSNLTALFYERVVSHIPLEVWANVFDQLQREYRDIRYSHHWVTLTRVSKTFYQAVYQMKHIFLNLRLFYVENLKLVDPSAVLERFQQLRHLTIPCFEGKLILPKLPHLSKLKLRYSNWKDCSPDTSKCARDGKFSLLEASNLPSLQYLSFRDSCMDPFLAKIPERIRERIKKLNINGIFLYPLNKASRLEYYFPNATFIKSLSLGFYMTPKFSQSLVELHCLYQQRLEQFTGKCRIYREYKTRTPNIQFLSGNVEKGQLIGQWIYCKK